MPAESKLENEIVGHARSLGFMAFKFTSPSQRGVPDRVFISPSGVCLFLEIKAPGKKPEPLQVLMISKLRKQGVAASWTDNFQRAASMLADLATHPEHFNEIYT